MLLFKMIAFFLLMWTSVVKAGVPGTTQTYNGYDTELGKDAVCWTGPSTALQDTYPNNATVITTPFPNPIVENFTLFGETKLLLECPKGVTLKAFAPPEFGTPPDYTDGIRPRTHEWYDFRIEFTLDLQEIQGNTFISDATPTIVAVQVIVCELGKVGFCSPFIHEEANARLAAQGITMSPPRGDRHGGTHVHSPYVNVTVSPTQQVQSFNATVPLIVNDPGHFYAIGALQFYTYDRDTSPTAQHRYDAANALDMTLLTYQDPPEILTVTRSAKIVASVFIGLACVAIGFLLFQTIKHRHNNVIRVSQGNFLILFLVAALWATVSAVFFNPKNDLYCNSVYPMVLIPMQILFSITVGRLWRIQAVISPLLMKKMKSDRGLVHGFGRMLARLTSCRGDGESHRSIRRTVSASRLAKVVVLFTFPQVIMQVIGYALDPDEVVVEFNDDESTGRQICESQLEPWTSYRVYSVILLLVLFLILLLVSYGCRNLPSLLNETAIICNSTVESLIALAVAFFVLLITDSPTTSPNIAYLVLVALTVTLTLNHSWRIMLPKLQMVWRGETIVISKLVSDQRRRAAEKEAHLEASLQGVTGFTPNASAMVSSVNSSGYSAGYKSASSFSRSSTGGYDDSEASNEDGGTMQTNEKVASVKSDKDAVTQAEEEEEGVLVFEDETAEEFKEEDTEVLKEQQDVTPSRTSPVHTVRFSDEDTCDDPNDRPRSPEYNASPKVSALRAKSSAALKRIDEITETTVESNTPHPTPQEGRGRHHHHHAPIAISDDETPSRRLVLRMVDLNLVLTRVNTRILSGLVVDHEDWKTLKEASVDLGRVFDDDVKFQWEESGGEVLT